MSKRETFRCIDCKATLPVQHVEGAGTGYGCVGKRRRKVCYACCATRERKAMQRTGRAFLYEVQDPHPRQTGSFRRTGIEVTNWPGTLRFEVTRVSRGRHNIGRKRIDVWFQGPGGTWHGVRCTDNGTYLRCKRLTGKRLGG